MSAAEDLERDSFLDRAWELVDRTDKENDGDHGRRWLEFAQSSVDDDGVSFIEMQALKVPTGRNGYQKNLFGFADDADTAHNMAKVQPDAPAVYVIANKLAPAISARAPMGTWRDQPQTKDADIVARLVLPIDIDPNRTKGVSATREEARAAFDVACAVYRFLVRFVGEDSLAVGFSGSGFWLFVALDAVPEDAEVAGTVKAVINAVADGFTTDAVEVDRTVCDAKRLVPHFGSHKRKGENRKRRPHRRTGIVTPSTPRRLTREDLFALRDAVCAEFPPKQTKSKALRRSENRPQPTTSGARSKASGAVSKSGETLFSLATGVPVATVVDYLGLSDGADLRCPRGCSGGTSVVVFEDERNRLKCSHNTCADMGANGGGWWSNVDMWAEVHGLSLKEAATAICEWAGLQVPTRRPTGAIVPFAKTPQQAVVEKDETRAPCVSANEPRVLVHRASYYVLDEERGWRGPKTAAELLAVAKVANLEIYQVTDKGSRLSKTAEIVDDHGTAVDDVFCDMAADEAMLGVDDNGRSFLVLTPRFEAPQLVPQHDDNVAAWLVALDPSGTISQWVSVAANRAWLGSPMPMAVVVADSRVGKNLLADALARAHRMRQAHEGGDLFANFQSSTDTGNVFHSEEQGFRDDRGRPLTRELRENPHGSNSSAESEACGRTCGARRCSASYVVELPGGMLSRA